MRDADTVLGIIRERGRRGLPLEQVYRQLYNPALYLRAYGRLARNRGAMTPGATPETADGMAQATIEKIITTLRQERYRWTPVRRTHIPKAEGKQRPLGLPTWSDKLLQEVIRSILEAYYEPQFSEHSHGFRRNHGCQTALSHIEHAWTGTVWFIEGDISQCFDTLDHAILVGILREKIHDNRFLRLVENLLRAGYLEGWKHHVTLSGVPQGGVVSPILSNIYLDRLDQFVETTLRPRYTRGEIRQGNPAYVAVEQARRHARRTGQGQVARQLLRQLRGLPSRDPYDPNYRRLRYVRYADDFLLGFVGPKAEAVEIKDQLGTFLRDRLRLELSAAKTLITHAATGRAHFLGYEVAVMRSATRVDRRGRRCANGRIRLLVPREVIQAKGRPYLRRGKPYQRFELAMDSAFSILSQYQAIYRGLVQYYRLARDLAPRLNRLAWAMQGSLVKTLANKYKVSSRTIYRRYGTSARTAAGTYRVLRVTVRRPGKPPLVAQWGGVPLKRQPQAVLDDQPARLWSDRSELLERFLAERCELCSATDQVEVHHVRHLKTLKMSGRRDKPAWAERMAARQRKTLVVCRRCHEGIHAGRPAGTPRPCATGEPDDAERVTSGSAGGRRKRAATQR
jgi:group II intron reverse transcriptase/maturase